MFALVRTLLAGSSRPRPTSRPVGRSFRPCVEGMEPRLVLTASPTGAAPIVQPNMTLDYHLLPAYDRQLVQAFNRSVLQVRADQRMILTLQREIRVAALHHKANLVASLKWQLSIAKERLALDEQRAEALVKKVQAEVERVYGQQDSGPTT